MGSSPSRERVFGLSKEDHLLYSPALLDLEHGTIRHRDREVVEEEGVRDGYFYHAQLQDWTNDSSIKDYQKKHVVEGPKSKNQLHYVYATGLDDATEDKGIVRVAPKPKGLGYRWRGDSEYRYFRLRFSRIREEEASDSETEEQRGYETIYRIHPKTGMSVGSLSEIVSFRLLVPTNRIVIVYKTFTLHQNTDLQSISPHYMECKMELKVITDVEVVRFNFDKDEPIPQSRRRLPSSDLSQRDNNSGVVDEPSEEPVMSVNTQQSDSYNSIRQ